MLFGDSFAECIDSVLCFEEILNADSTFNPENFLLNYGTTGYGVDQIFLACSLSIKNYNNPFVVFSFMPEDMERSLVTVRTAPKPYFLLENNDLVLKGIPVDSNPQKFFNDNPVSIKSYMWARYKHSDLSGFKIVPDDFEKTKRITEKLNSKIILLADSLLKTKCTQYVFLIFDNIFSDTGPWRVNFLRKMMVENNIPFICTSDLIAYDMRYNNLTNRDYFIPKNGHPGTRYNLVVSQAIKDCVKNYTLYMDSIMIWNKKVNDTTSVEHFVLGITSYDKWLNEVKEKAVQKKLSVDSVIMQDAIYMRSLLHLPDEIPDTTSIGYIVKKIKNSEVWLSQIKLKAIQNKIPLDSMIILDAVYMHEQMTKTKAN